MLVSDKITDKNRVSGNIRGRITSLSESTLTEQLPVNKSKQ